ncbi:hypothetical protein PINS_up000982 [Pythium insidiosum]|nr:hypothetical protein PINS_up000982 [Pythium insidiosum]
MSAALALLAVVASLLAAQTSSCLLAGADTGTCTDPSDFDLLLPFCKTVVPYTACLPRYQSLWYNHSALTKDKFVEQMFNKLVTQRKMYETNRTFLDKNTDEWGSKHEIQPRFIENPDCENAFRNYFCWLNFPRCDAEGRSLLLCRSVCENYMKACQMSSDLWRCGDPKYVNGRSPEISSTWIVRTIDSIASAHKHNNAERSVGLTNRLCCVLMDSFPHRTKRSSTTAHRTLDRHSRTMPWTLRRVIRWSSARRVSRTEPRGLASLHSPR